MKKQKFKIEKFPYRYFSYSLQIYLFVINKIISRTNHNAPNQISKDYYLYLQKSGLHFN